MATGELLGMKPLDEIQMTPETTQALIEEVKRRAGELKAAREKADPGQWIMSEVREVVDDVNHVLGGVESVDVSAYEDGPIICHMDNESEQDWRDNAAFITHAANECNPLADLALRLARVVECLDGSLGNTLDCLEQNEDPDTVAIEIIQKAREQARKIACGEE